jgi:MFS family permease
VSAEIQKEHRASLWRNSEFRLFWVGETVSLFGTQVTLLALPLAAIIVLHSSTLQVGILRLMALLPYLLLSLLFGAVADARPLRPLMIGSNMARLVLIGLVPVLAAVGKLALGWLYGITLLAGSAAVMFDVCWISYVPTIISDRTYLIEANSRLGASASAADLAGPGLAGLLVGLLTAPIAVAVDAASYLVSIVSLLSIKTRESKPDRSGSAKRNIPAEITEGMRWVFHNSLLRPLALLGACYNFFLLYVETVFLVYAVRELSINTTIIGVILSASGVGGIAGAVFVNAAIRRLGVGAVYAISVTTSFSVWILVPIASGPAALRDGILALAFLLNGFTLGMMNVVVVSLRQAVTPARLMGRMNAVMRMLIVGIGSLGGPVGGVLADWLGLRPALWVCAAGSIVALVVLFPRPVARLKALPEPEVTG